MSRITKRLYILVALLLVGYSMIWLLPKSTERKLTCLERHLPHQVATFVGQDRSVTGKELEILSKDTEFERLGYRDTRKPNQPEIEASIVFSGTDLNNSIHRPERCLRSQGWNFVKERKIIVKNALADGSDVPFREIVCTKPVRGKGGREFEVMRVQYYTFFGHSVITESHYGRTIQDMSDRLFKGFDQQWAYATFSMPVTEHYAKQGLMAVEDTLSLEDSEAVLRDFIQQLLPLVVKKPTN